MEDEGVSGEMARPANMLWEWIRSTISDGFSGGGFSKVREGERDGRVASRWKV